MRAFSPTDPIVSRLERLVDGLSFPTSLVFDDEGALYIAEAGLPFGGAEPGGRVWRYSADGSRTVLAAALRPPVNGLSFHEGALYISEGGHPSRITRLARDGSLTPIVEGLPGPGNYHTNMSVVGPDGWLYFSQGAMTNSGIVGLDAYELGWLRRLPHAHDLPGCEIELAGVNVETADPLDENGAGAAITGAFVPFGQPTTAGQRIRAQLPCTAAVLRCQPDGRNLELVAWGLRNAYGLGFDNDGRLLAIDQGADERGSRPIGNAPDLLYEVHKGGWYGWPDFIGGRPITDARFQPSRGPAPTFILRNHQELPAPERPLLEFPPHSAAVKFDTAGDGRLVVALFGDERPMTAPEGPSSGRGIAIVEPSSWKIDSVIRSEFARPIDVRRGPDGAIYIADFGRFEIDPQRGVVAEAGSGCIWSLVTETKRAANKDTLLERSRAAQSI
jgi:glucose/arabinose dehydrogenase